MDRFEGKFIPLKSDLRHFSRRKEKSGKFRTWNVPFNPFLEFESNKKLFKRDILLTLSFCLLKHRKLPVCLLLIASNSSLFPPNYKCFKIVCSIIDDEWFDWTEPGHTYSWKTIDIAFVMKPILLTTNLNTHFQLIFSELVNKCQSDCACTWDRFD